MSKENVAMRASRVSTTKKVVAPPQLDVRSKPVRVTADLPPQTYRALLAYCADIAEETGRARVPHVEVIRALLDELEVNPVLQRSVRKIVTRTK